MTSYIFKNSPPPLKFICVHHNVVYMSETFLNAQLVNMQNDDGTITMPVLPLPFVEFYKHKDTSSCDEGRDEPLVEFVDDFEIHVTGGPHLFINQVESRMGNELIQMTMIVFLFHTI